MKLFKTISLLILSLIIAHSTLAQQSRTRKVKVQTPQQSISKKNNSNLTTTSIWKSRANNQKSQKLESDTLNFPFAGTLAIYGSDEGYVSGNNEFLDKVKAEFFNPIQPLELSGVLFNFAVATSSPANIEIAVWDNNGTDGKPGNKLGSTQIVLDDILLNILNDQLTHVSFDTPIFIGTPFYVGAYLPTGAGDTLVVYSNTDGDANPATAWEQWSDDDWYRMDDPDSWGLEIAHAIFPIVTYSNSLTTLFTASPTLLLPEESVQFTDQSFGSPISWSWFFDGGQPSSSTEQNPQVTYDQTGVFSVKLVISNAEAQDSLTKLNYINVMEELPPNSDTLLFPLPGTYVVYIITNNGGFVTGNNKFNDQAKANYFEIPEAGKITGVLYDFAYAVGGNPQIELKIWDNDEGKGVPGNELSSTSVAFDIIKADVEDQHLTYIPINPPIPMDHPFFAGFTLPTNVGDTLVAWSNTDGNTSPSNVWDLWEDNTWHPLSSTYVLDIAMGVHPIVEYITGIPVSRSGNLKTSAVPNPTSGITRIEIPKTERLLEWQVFDSKGICVLQKKPANENVNPQINLTNFPNGNYVVKLITEKQVYTAKIVKE